MQAEAGASPWESCLAWIFLTFGEQADLPIGVLSLEKFIGYVRHSFSMLATGLQVSGNKQWGMHFQRKGAEPCC